MLLELFGKQPYLTSEDGGDSEDNDASENSRENRYDPNSDWHSSDPGSEDPGNGDGASSDPGSEDPGNDNQFERAREKLARELVFLFAETPTLRQRGLLAIIKAYERCQAEVSVLYGPHNHRRPLPKSFSGLKGASNVDFPPLQNYTGYFNSETTETEIRGPQETLAKAKPEETIVFNLAFVPPAEIIRIHRETHFACGEYCDSTNVIFSSDGIQDSASNTRSLCSYTIRFMGCRAVYTVGLQKPHNSKGNSLLLGEYKYTFLNHVLSEILKAHLHIVYVVCDAPKRSFMLSMLGHMGEMPCHQCHMRGKYKLPDKFANQKLTRQQMAQKSKMVFPSSTCDQEPRTHAEWDRITKSLPQFTKQNNHLQGYTGRSPLLSMEPPIGNIVSQVRIDYMHSLCENVIKSYLEFVLGKLNREGTAAISRKREFSYINLPLVNKHLMEIRVPSEFSRQQRPLELSSLKAEELRNFVHFFFPVLLSKLNDTNAELQLWIMLVAISRMATLPNDEYMAIPEGDEKMKKYGRMAYVAWEKAFSQDNASYNCHIIFAHSEDLRDNGPCTTYSTFNEECEFSRLRAAIRSGTPNVESQLVERLFLYNSRRPEAHSCDRILKFASEAKSRRDDTLIYTWKENTGYQFYRITEVHNSEVAAVRLNCSEYRVTFTSKMTRRPVVINFSEFGVAVYNTDSDTQPRVILQKSQIKGKAVRCHSYVSTVARGLLNEVLS